MLRPGAVIVFVTMVLEATASSREPSFSRVETYPEMGRLDYILAVADFNDDGRDDILAGGREEAVLDGQPEDRHDTTALAVFFGQEDGTFEHAPDLIDGTIEAWQPIVVAADFNNDEQIDVVVNDGTGHYPERIGLPRVDFNEGYTSIRFVTHFDFNADGFEDLLLVHARNSRPMGPPAFTGRHLQALINDGGESFVDETPTWLGDQSLTEQVYYPNGDLVYGDANPRMLDIDRDGCEDIVMANSNTLIRPESPIFYLNNGSGQFQPVDPDEMFTGMDWSGIYGVPADVNGDDVIDLVFPQRVVGPDDEYGTEDDSTRFLTLLNTTPPSPVRCEEPDESDGTI